MNTSAVHVAKIARRRPRHAFAEEVSGCCPEIVRVAVEIGQQRPASAAVSRFRKSCRLREEDDAMDNLHRQLFTHTARNRAREE